jgi:hypothetical protein
MAQHEALARHSGTGANNPKVQRADTIRHALSSTSPRVAAPFAVIGILGLDTAT